MNGTNFRIALLRNVRGNAQIPRRGGQDPKQRRDCVNKNHTDELSARGLTSGLPARFSVVHAQLKDGFSPLLGRPGIFGKDVFVLECIDEVHQDALLNRRGKIIIASRPKPKFLCTPPRTMYE